MMTIVQPYVCLMLTVLFLSGCSKKDEQPPAEQQPQGALEQMNQTAENMKKATEELTGALSSEKEPTSPVSFKVLMGFLPGAVEGLIAGKPEGESASFGEWAFSQARIEFHSSDGNRQAIIQIFDYAFISMLYAPYQMMLNMKFKRESTQGYERSIRFADHPAYEKWDSGSERNELIVMLGERFIVNIETRGLAEGAARMVGSSMDMKKLAVQKTQ